MKIKRATAIYTGGGIYQYHGQFDNGNFFLCFTDWEDCMMELDADPAEDYESSGYPEWQTEHTVRELPVMESYKMLMDALHWILKNHPDGNYNDYDIKKAVQDLKLTTSTRKEI